jgi:transposase-like protein
MYPYVKMAGRWRYLYRAVDQYGQVVDVHRQNDQRHPTPADVSAETQRLTAAMP